MVPIKSADLIEEAFNQAGKKNLYYARYQDLGHALTDEKMCTRQCSIGYVKKAFLHLVLILQQRKISRSILMKISSE